MSVKEAKNGDEKGHEQAVLPAKPQLAPNQQNVS